MGLIELSQIKNMDTSVAILQVTLIAGTDTERQLPSTHFLYPPDKGMSYNMVVKTREPVTLCKIMHN